MNVCVKIFIARRNLANTNRFISLDRLIRGVKVNNTGPLGYFSFQPVPYDWCNKVRGYVLFCPWDDVYIKNFAANRKE